MVSNLCQAVNARPFPFSFISNLTFATRTVWDPVSLLVFHGAWSNGCNMEEVEEVIEPTTECIIDCVAFFVKREKGGGGGNYRQKNKFRCRINRSEKCLTKLRESIW